MNQKGFSNTLGILLTIVIIAGAVGYFVFFQKQETAPIIINIPTPNSVQNTPPANTPASGVPSLSADKKSIIVEDKMLLTIDDESILNYFRDPRTQVCDASNITSTPDRKSFCTDKSTFKNKTRFASIVISPDKTKMGFTIESDTLSPDTVVGMLYPYRATSRINFLSNYYLGNEFISFSPNGINFVFKHNCFENNCGFSIKNSDTLSDDIINFGMLPDHTDYRFVKWISDNEIEYKDGTELKRKSF